MSGVFSPRLDVLPPEQRSIWPNLRPAAHLGWVLYGGTAIALRLGHRTSIDFDFFASRRLDRNGLRAVLPFMALSTVLQDEPETLTVMVPASDADGSVKLSFFGGIDFGRVGAPDWTDDGVALVASLADLMATELKILLQRVEAKDYRDIAAMVRAGASLEHGLAAARLLYGGAFQPGEGLKALVYFEGGDLADLSVDDRHLLIEAVRAVREAPEVTLSSRQLRD